MIPGTASTVPGISFLLIARQLNFVPDYLRVLLPLVIVIVHTVVGGGAAIIVHTVVREVKVQSGILVVPGVACKAEADSPRGIRRNIQIIRIIQIAIDQITQFGYVSVVG